MSYIKQAKQVLKQESEGIAHVAELLGEAFEKTIDAILTANTKGYKVVIFGVGKCQPIADKICATLNSTGVASVVLNVQNALHGDLGLLQNGDVVIALSYSGETNELLNLLPHIKRFNIHLTAITSKTTSSLAKHSDSVILCEIEEEACPLNLAPTTSSTAMLALGDALAMVLLQARQFKAEDFARYHPGGSLGRALLLKVSDMMRRKDSMAIITGDKPVLQGLHKMNTHRCGACVIVDNEDKLQAIFTHGDFARAYEANQQIGEHQISVFTQGKRLPIHIQQDVLAVEALKLFEQYNIDEIVVVDNDLHVVGLIDIQDLAQHQLI